MSLNKLFSSPLGTAWLLEKTIAYGGVFCLAAFLGSGAVYAEKSKKDYELIWGRVTHVYDGDTIAIKGDNGKDIRIQLAYIDAPDEDRKTGEKQPLHKESLRILKEIISGKEVIIESTGKDKFNRVQGLVFLDRINVNLMMVRKGMAELYHPVRTNPVRFERSYVEKFQNAEKYAQKAKAGVWGLDAYLSPYKFRRRNK